MPRHDRYENRSVGCVYTCMALLFGNYLDTDRDKGSLCIIHIHLLITRYIAGTSLHCAIQLQFGNYLDTS